jgi:hypothetical protein
MMSALQGHDPTNVWLLIGYGSRPALSLGFSGRTGEAKNTIVLAHSTSLARCWFHYVRVTVSHTIR